MLSLSAFAMACARPGQAPAPSLAPQRPATPLELQLRLAIDQVVTVRGLKELEPVSAEELSHEQFEALLDSGTESGDILSRNSDVVAFYHKKKKRIFVRRDVPLEASSENVMSLQDVLTHEVTHALQYQHFRASIPEQFEDRDALLANQALIEGDATLVQYLCRALRRRESKEEVADQLVGFVRWFEREDEVDDAVETDEDPGSRAQRRLEESLTYAAGVRFVASLYRAGGFELVNRAFRSAPQSTADVLHPERYVAGVGRRTIASLVPPGGPAAPQGTLGELGVMALLVDCLPLRDAEEATRGWTGDRVLSAPGGADAPLLLVAAWEDAEHARRFEQVAKRCLSDESTKRTTTRLDGTVFAFATNVEDPASALRYAMNAVGPMLPARPPLGAVRLSPVPPRGTELPVEAEGEVLSNGLWRSAYLGLTAPLPSGYSRVPNKNKSVLRIEHPSGERVRVALLAATPTKSPLRHQDVITGVVVGLEAEGFSTSTKGSGLTRGPSGDAQWTAWHASKSGVGVEMRVATVPWCGGRVLLSVSVAWPSTDKAGAAELETWATTLRPLPGEAPICAALRTQADREAREAAPAAAPRSKPSSP